MGTVRRAPIGRSWWASRGIGYLRSMSSQTDAGAFVRPPGTDLRRRRGVAVELIGCAWNGHALVGTDAAEVAGEDALVVRPGHGGTRWHRCLRCDAWMLLPEPARPTRPRPAGRDEIVLPTRGRPLKSRYVLRGIALTRAFNVLVLLLVLGGAVAVLVNETTLRDDLVANAAALQAVLAARRSVSSRACSPAAPARCGSSRPDWWSSSGSRPPRASGCGARRAGVST